MRDVGPLPAAARRLLADSGSASLVAYGDGVSAVEVGYSDWVDRQTLRTLQTRIFDEALDKRRRLWYPGPLGCLARARTGEDQSLRIDTGGRFSTIGVQKSTSLMGFVVLTDIGLVFMAYELEGHRYARALSDVQLNGCVGVGQQPLPASWSSSPGIAFLALPEVTRTATAADGFVPDVMDTRSQGGLVHSAETEDFFEVRRTSLVRADARSGAIDRCLPPLFLRRVLPSPDGHWFLVIHYCRAERGDADVRLCSDVYSEDGTVHARLRDEEFVVDPLDRPQKDRETDYKWNPTTRAELTWPAMADGRVRLMQWSPERPSHCLYETQATSLSVRWTESGTALAQEVRGDTDACVALTGHEPISLWSVPHGTIIKALPLLPSASGALAERKGAVLSFALRGDRTEVSAHALASGQTTRLVNAQMSELGDVIGAADDPERTVVGIGLCDRYDAHARVRSIAFPQGLAQPPADLDVQVVHCQRTDGAPLSPRVWTQCGSKGRKPLLLWVYPSTGLPKSPVHSALDLRGATPVALTYAGFAVACVEIPILGGRPGANDTLIGQTVDSLTCLAARLAALPGIDSDRMAIGGFSYGAALTTIALAHTSRFRAGLVRSGCYNRTQTPFGFQDERRWLWEVPHLYIQLSPLLYAHKIHAPVLFIHGLQDTHPATPAAQSVALFRALKRLGKNARCVLLPDEGHEQQSLPAAERILAEMTAWLKAHMEP